MGIANTLFFDKHLEIDDFLEVPIFRETLAVVSMVREQGHHSFETFKDLFMWGLSYLLGSLFILAFWEDDCFLQNLWNP